MSTCYGRVCDICGAHMVETWTVFHFKAGEDTDVCKKCTPIVNNCLRMAKSLRKSMEGERCTARALAAE